MITVIGMWEPDWMESGRTERRFWKQTLQSYKVDEWIMCPPQGRVFTSPLQFADVATALANTANTGKRIYLTPAKTAIANDIPYTMMNNYVHPTDAIYIFGSGAVDNVSLITANDDVVAIDTVTDTDWFAPLAMSVALYDRFSKA